MANPSLRGKLLRLLLKIRHLGRGRVSDLRQAFALSEALCLGVPMFQKPGRESQPRLQPEVRAAALPEKSLVIKEPTGCDVVAAGWVR